MKQTHQVGWGMDLWKKSFILTAIQTGKAQKDYFTQSLWFN